LVAADGSVEGGGEVVGCGDGKAGDAVCLGKRCIVGVDYFGAGGAAWVFSLLVSSYRSVRPIVEYQYDGHAIVLRSGSDLLTVHLKVAVPGKADDGALWI